MKLLFVAINAKYPHTNLAVRLLKNEAEKTGFDCEFVEHTINSDIKFVFNDLLDRKCDAYAFSCYIWNIDYIIKLSKLIKKQNKFTKIIIGGPEVSFDADMLLKKYDYIDYLIRCEGEKAIKDLTLNFQGKMEIENCASLVYRKRNKIIQNNIKIDDSFITAYFPYSYLEKLNGRVIYYEASRGCPFNCSFCLSSESEKYREKPADIVKRDLSLFIKAEVKIVKFVDRTFNTNKKRALELIGFIIDNSKDTCFHLELAPSLLYDEILDLLKKAKPGVFQLELGVQSTNKKTLKTINRNEDFKSFAPKIKQLIDYKNMHVHVDLIAGLPFEGISEFKKSFDDVFSLYSDNLQLGFLKLLKGSPLRDQAKEYGIVFEKNAPYEFIKTSSLSKKEVKLIKEIEYLLKRFYNSSLYDNSIKYLASEFGSAFDMFMSLNEYIKTNYLDPKSFKEFDLAKVLVDFAKKNNLKHVNDLVLYESLNKRKRPNLPSYLLDQSRFDFKDRYLRKNNISKLEGKSLFPVLFNFDVLSFIKSDKVMVKKQLLIFDYSDFNSGVKIYQSEYHKF